MSDRARPSRRPGRRWMRLRGMMRKEFRQIVRDPSSIAIAFVLPLILLFIFGYGVSLDATDVPLALVVETPSAETAAFVSVFERSAYFAPQRFASVQAAEDALKRGRVDGIVWLRVNFTADLLDCDPAAIGVFINGVDA
ncbi:MAG TPA: ABC transporter permease, partial [Desulfobacterales bacterium]|nr:ABC transporter permease [Desulfobacterales bacterium]